MFEKVGSSLPNSAPANDTPPRFAKRDTAHIMPFDSGERQHNDAPPKAAAAQNSRRLIGFIEMVGESTRPGCWSVPENGITAQKIAMQP